MTDDCWLCTIPPGRMSPALLQARCRCGASLQEHCYGPPHPLETRGCQGFTIDTIWTTAPQPEPDTQPALF
jgi:hypothetical protein